MEVKCLYQELPIDPLPVQTALSQGLLYELLAVAVKYGLFESLRSPCSPVELAAEKDWEPEAVTAVVEALYLAGFLTKPVDGKFQGSPAVNTYLLPDSPLYLGDSLLPDLPAGSFGDKIIKFLTTKKPAARTEPEWTPERLKHIGIMALANGNIKNTVAAVDLSAAEKLLDLGGGHGFYSIAWAQKYPRLKVTVFDLPPVIKLAADFVRHWGLENRIQLLGGDFMQDDIGVNYDAVFCSLILANDRRDFILAKVWQALRYGGRIIMRCHTVDSPLTTANVISRLFYRMRGNNEIASLPQLMTWLTDHGFSSVKLLNISGMFATIGAEKK